MGRSQCTCDMNLERGILWRKVTEQGGKSQGDNGREVNHEREYKPKLGTYENGLKNPDTLYTSQKINEKVTPIESEFIRDSALS